MYGICNYAYTSAVISNSCLARSSVQQYVRACAHPHIPKSYAHNAQTHNVRDILECAAVTVTRVCHVTVYHVTGHTSIPLCHCATSGLD